MLPALHPGSPGCILVYMSGVVSVRLDDDLKSRLDALSASTRRPSAVYVREALELYLEDLEDYYMATEVSDRLAHGREDVVSLQDARRELLG